MYWLAQARRSDLITLRGLRAIQSADVLMYDKLVHPSLLEYARRDVELVDVGKQAPRRGGATVGGRPGGAAPRRMGSTMQQAINRRMVEQAQDGKSGSVKGGDPFIFGRGGEAVGGSSWIYGRRNSRISAGMAAASYAGIPLTHRHESIGPFFDRSLCS